MRHRIEAQSIPVGMPPAALIRILERALATMRIWRERAHQRRQLQELSDRDLRDIGISRLDAIAECRKPFWHE